MAAAGTDRSFVNGPRNSIGAPLPFSDAVLVGDTLFIAGHLGIDPKTERAAADPHVGAKLAMERIKATVENAGLAMDDVVSMQVHCTDLALYDTFNECIAAIFRMDFRRRRISVPTATSFPSAAAPHPAPRQ